MSEASPNLVPHNPKNRIETPEAQATNTNTADQTQRDAAQAAIDLTMSTLTKDAEFTDVVRIPSIGTVTTLYAKGRGYSAQVTNIEDSPKGPVITLKTPDDYPEPIKQLKLTLEEFNGLLSLNKSGPKTHNNDTQENNKSDAVKDNAKEAAYAEVTNRIYENINDVTTQFATKEVPPEIIAGQLLIAKNELETAGFADKYAELATIITQYFADHKEYVTPTTPGKLDNVNTPVKRMSEAEFNELKKLSPDQFASKVADQLAGQFPNQPIPERVIGEQQLYGALYETKWGSVDRRANKKNAVSEKIGELLRQHNEAVLPQIEQKLTQELDGLIQKAGTQRLDQAALSPLTKSIIALSINNATEPYIRLRQKLDAKIDAHNRKAFETEIRDTETKYTQALQALIAKYPTTNVPDDELAAFQAQVKSELSGTYSDKYIESFQKVLASQVEDHKIGLAAAETARLIDEKRKELSGEAAKEFEASIDKALGINPTIEKDINNISRNLNTILQSTTLDSGAIQAGYEQALADLAKVPGMNKMLLASVKRQWEGMRKIAEDLLPVQTLVTSYLTKTDTPIPKVAAESVMALLNSAPDLNNAQRKAILENITLKFVAHNEAIKNAPKKPTTKPPPLPSKAATIGLDSSELENVTETIASNPAPDKENKTEAMVSDPEFNNKLDDLDAIASKLLQSMSTSLTNNVIDLEVLSNLLKLELKKQNLKTDSKEAKTWLEGQMETAKQINQGIESLNQAEEKVRETIANCHQEIDTLIASPDISTLEERASLQETINTLTDGPEKTELQNRLAEIRDHDQAILQADALMEKTLAAGTEIDATTFQIDLQIVLPPNAQDAYWKIAQEIIEDHNKNLVKTTPPEDSKEDIFRNDRLVNEVNDQITELLISGDHVSIKEIAELQAKIDSITDDETKTALQKHIIEIQDYNQALTQADSLLESALASKKVINAAEIKDSLSKLIPTASERYWDAAGEMINEHNATLATPDNIPPVVIQNDQPPAVDAQVAAPSATVVSTPDPAPQADVLAAVPVDSKVTIPTDVLNKVEATALSSEQIAKRDQMFNLIEKNLILNEQEKGRLMAKVMDLVRTATRNTNVVGELQKLVTDNGLHQESQRQWKEEGPIFAAVIQSAVQSALNTNDLDYRRNEADYQKMLSELPTEAARTAMKAVYEEAISNKKLRENSKALQAKVDQVLANQADFADKRGESLNPLFQRMNVIIKTGLPRESQVLGSQTIAPDVSQWAAPVTEEQSESFRAKAKRRFLELFDRIRGKKPETEEIAVDTAHDIEEAFVRTPAEMVDFLVESNKDLTNEEKDALRKTAVEQLEKGTDITKTIENLKTALSDRARINREIAAVVLNAPELSKQMYFAIAAALDNDLSAEKRTAALVQWQGFVDQLPTDRAKAAVKRVYQEALKDKKLGTDVNSIEERLMDQLADTGAVEDREKALTDLVNALGKEINQAIQNRKPIEPLVDQAPDVAKAVVNAATEVLANTSKETIDTNDKKLSQSLKDNIASENLIGEHNNRDILPAEFFASDMDQLIKTMAGEKDADLNVELKAIRQMLVETKPDTVMGTEALDRLTKALKAKYPEVLATITEYIGDMRTDHNNRIEMQTEIAAKSSELLARIDTLSSEDISGIIKALHDKFTIKLNKFAVDRALVPLNDALRERMHTLQAVKEIDQLWKTEPSLALDKVANILSNNQLDQTMMTKLVAFAKNMALTVNAATAEKRQISAAERGTIIFGIIPYMSVSQELRSALASKVNKMIDSFNSQPGPDKQANANAA